jgi:imidazole glycerol-phosphate synthase subunit HisF
LDPLVWAALLLVLKRIIPSLLLRRGRLVKGVTYGHHRDAGRPETTARAHNAQGADELLLLDIDAGREGREPDFSTVAAVARACLMPLTVGGGIRTLETAHRCMEAGADKICLTSTAMDDPGLIGRIARIFGAQAIVLGVDVITINRRRCLYDHRTHRAVEGIAWDEWLKRGVDEGAGEVRIMAVDREGTRTGLDVALLADAAALVEVPIILEGGAGSLDQVANAMKAGADAVALGTMLVFSDNNIYKVKSFLKNAGLEIRL